MNKVHSTYTKAHVLRYHHTEVRQNEEKIYLQLQTQFIHVLGDSIFTIISGRVPIFWTMHFSTYNTVLHKNQFTTTRWTMEPSLMLSVRRSVDGRITLQIARGSVPLVYTILKILEAVHVPLSVITSCFVLQDVVQPQWSCIPIPIKFLHC